MRQKDYQRLRNESIKLIKFALKELNLETKIDCQKLTQPQKTEVFNFLKESCPFINNRQAIRIWKTELNLILSGLGIIEKFPLIPINKNKNPEFGKFTPRVLIGDPRQVRFL